MDSHLAGLHHVTAICGDPQRNIDFYTGILGLRLVKVTVNFDDPEAYHLYYGDSVGSPGTILTFFAWPGAEQGRLGAGQIADVGFTVPAGTLPFWQSWLDEHAIVCTGPIQRFDESVLALHDPDGLDIEIVAHAEGQNRTGWTHGPVPALEAIRGLHAVTLWETRPESTVAFLERSLEFKFVAEAEQRMRYSPASGPGTFVDVRYIPTSHHGAIAVGTTHHVAWRSATDEDQLGWRDHLVEAGAHVTPVLDREYFQSIYFHEPGGVLFEIATDPPGFTIDEPPEELGTHLKLPPWLEEKRDLVELALPRIRFPSPLAE
ncbi:MAG: ring-cleaving dioxygenase [Ktedonobacterales bacterium]